MEKIEEIPNIREKRIFWKQPKTLDKYFELYVDETLICTLGFRSAFGTYAEAITSSQTWTFKRVGFINSRITIRQYEQENDFGIYYPRFFGGGDLHFMDGKKYLWRSTNFWQTNWILTDEGNIPVLEFIESGESRRLSEIFKTQALVNIHSPSLIGEQLELLLPFCFYLMIMHKNDAAAGAAAASAS